jgi:hypothetical protein
VIRGQMFCFSLSLLLVAYSVQFSISEIEAHVYRNENEVQGIQRDDDIPVIKNFMEDAKDVPDTQQACKYKTFSFNRARCP